LDYIHWSEINFRFYLHVSIRDILYELM